MKKSRRSAVTHSFAEESQSRRYSISDIYEERDAKSEGRESIGSRSFGSSISSVQDEMEMGVEERMKEYFGPKSSDFIQDVR